MSFLKRAFKNVFERPITNLMSLGHESSLKDYLQQPEQWARDFKDWYDGTAAQRKANRLNIENWNLQNAYNTPEAQMARYAAAGLNPNLIYSQSNEAGSIASVQAAHSGAETLSKAAQTIASFYSIAGMIANVNNLRQQNKNLQSQDSLLGAQAEFTRAQARRYDYDTEWLRQNGLSTFSPPFERNAQVGFGYVSDFLSSPQGRDVINALTAALGSSDGSNSGKFNWNRLNPFYYLMNGLGHFNGNIGDTRLYPTKETPRSAYRRAFNRRY